MDILFKYKTADIADRRMFCVLIFFFLIRCHKCNCNRRRAILIPTNMYIIVIFYGIPNAMDGSMAFWRSQIAQFSGSVRLWFLTSQINERRWINWNDRIQMAQCGSSGMACAATTVMATDGTEECYNIIKRSFNTTDRWSTASDKRRCLNTFFFYYVFITAKSLQPIRTIHRYLNRCACLHSAQKFRLQRCLLRFKYYEIYFMWLIEWCLVWSTQAHVYRRRLWPDCRSLLSSYRNAKSSVPSISSYVYASRTQLVVAHSLARKPLTLNEMTIFSFNNKIFLRAFDEL